MSAKEIGALLRGNFATRPTPVSARVVSVPTDSTGKPLNHVICEVNGQPGIKAYVLPGATLYPGDAVRLEGDGGAATTVYRVAGFQAGIRPDSGDIEIVTDTTIGNNPYGAGDRIWGNPLGTFFHMDYDAGKILGKTGAAIGLILDAAGAITIGDPAGVHQVATATGIALRAGGTDLMTLDGTNGIRQYGGGVQRSHLRQDGSGWFIGSDKLFWDTSGNLSLSGDITAESGTITGDLVIAPGGRIVWDEGVLDNTGLPPTDHGWLTGLGDDDHDQYVHMTLNRSITALHTFAPATPRAPFALGAQAEGWLVAGLHADMLDSYHAAELICSVSQSAPNAPHPGQLWLAI